MRFVIVTGMSGAGKSTAMKILEDVGYFCVDNLPVPLITRFAELAYGSMSEEVDKVALGIDSRSGKISDVEGELELLKSKGLKVEILYMDSGDDTLIKRFKETRRSHPLMAEGRVDEGIALERQVMSGIKKKADYICNTDGILVKDLRAQLEKIFVANEKYNNLFINVVSFGFKYGIPTDSDLVFDVRFMPNPYYVEDLKKKTGNDKEVNDYVMASDVSVEFLKKLEDMIDFLIPNYIAEGKNQLVISVGCTGGKHRSVTIANKLYEKLSGKGDYGLKVTHRDIERE